MHFNEEQIELARRSVVSIFGGDGKGMTNIILRLLRSASLIASAPPSGKYKVTNLYVDPSTGKLTVDYDDIPVK